MHKLLPFLIIVCCLTGSCQGHQPTSIPAPDPRVETFTFDRMFRDMALDQSGTPWLRSVAPMENEDPLSSHVDEMATVKMELYYHDLDWHMQDLLPGEEFIVSLEADRRLGILYILTTQSLYRIR